MNTQRAGPVSARKRDPRVAQFNTKRTSSPAPRPCRRRLTVAAGKGDDLLLPRQSGASHGARVRLPAPTRRGPKIAPSHLERLRGITSSARHALALRWSPRRERSWLSNVPLSAERKHGPDRCLSIRIDARRKDQVVAPALGAIEKAFKMTPAEIDHQQRAEDLLCCCVGRRSGPST